MHKKPGLPSTVLGQTIADLSSGGPQANAVPWEYFTKAIAKAARALSWHSRTSQLFMRAAGTGASKFLEMCRQIQRLEYLASFTLACKYHQTGFLPYCFSEAGLAQELQPPANPPPLSHTRTTCMLANAQTGGHHADAP